MILEIKKIGENVLREVSLPVDVINGEVKKLAKNMESTMKKFDGAGIAAPQVGILKRIIVVRPENKTYVLINPEIKFKSKESVCKVEGCLSVPNKNIKVSRSKSIAVEFLDLDGEAYEMEASDMMARVIQHEVDHLDGKLIVDYEEEDKKKIKAK